MPQCDLLLLERWTMDSVLPSLLALVALWGEDEQRRLGYVAQ